MSRTRYQPRHRCAPDPGARSGGAARGPGADLRLGRAHPARGGPRRRRRRGVGRRRDPGLDRPDAPHAAARRPSAAGPVGAGAALPHPAAGQAAEPDPGHRVELPAAGQLRPRGQARRHGLHEPHAGDVPRGLQRRHHPGLRRSGRPASTRRAGPGTGPSRPPPTTGPRRSTSSTGCRPTTVRWRAGSGSCTSSGTATSGASTGRRTAGGPTAASPRTPTTCTSASAGTAPRSAPRGGPACRSPSPTRAPASRTPGSPPRSTPAGSTTACTTPPKAPHSTYALVWPGQSSSSVKVAQKALGLTADGTFGASTRTALIAWQKAHGVPVTGVLDNATWAKLVPPPPPPRSRRRGTGRPRPVDAAAGSLTSGIASATSWRTRPASRPT